MKRIVGLSLAALLLSTPAAAQLGAATQSPPPEGVADGKGAARYPRGGSMERGYFNHPS